MPVLLKIDFSNTEETGVIDFGHDNEIGRDLFVHKNKEIIKLSQWTQKLLILLITLHNGSIQTNYQFHSKTTIWTQIRRLYDYTPAAWLQLLS